MAFLLFLFLIFLKFCVFVLKERVQKQGTRNRKHRVMVGNHLFCFVHIKFELKSSIYIIFFIKHIFNFILNSLQKIVSGAGREKYAFRSGFKISFSKVPGIPHFFRQTLLCELKLETNCNYYKCPFP